MLTLVAAYHGNPHRECSTVHVGHQPSLNSPDGSLPPTQHREFVDHDQLPSPILWVVHLHQPGASPAACTRTSLTL